ncbi:MAG: hypothetical protein PUP92_13105 [Rhizonema sp. PD38]|nr:hypothetical protein [Rhizonema sp. PD38]
MVSKTIPHKDSACLSPQSAKLSATSDYSSPENVKLSGTRDYLSRDQPPEPLTGNDSNVPQTYSDFIQTLSESERANFLHFCEEATTNLSQQVNDIEAWLAHKTKAGLNRWEVYHQKFKAKQKTQTNKSKSSSSSKMMNKFQLEIEQQRQRAEKAWFESSSATETGGTA